MIRRSLRAKLIVALIVFLMANGAMSFWVIRTSNQENRATEKVYEINHIISLLQTATNDLADARRGSRSYLFYGESTWVTQFQQQIIAYQSGLAEVQRLIGDDPERQAVLNSLIAMSSTWETNEALRDIDYRNNLVGTSGEIQQAALAFAESQNAMGLYSALSSQLRTVIANETEVLDDQIALADDYNDQLNATLIGVGVAIALFGSISVAYLYTSVARPAIRLSHVARRFGEGEYTARTGISRQDEIGRAAAAFDQLADRIQELIANLVTSEEAARVGYDRAERERIIAEAVINSVNDVMMLIDTDDRVVFVNRRHRELFAIEDSEVVGRDADNLDAMFDRIFKDPRETYQKLGTLDAHGEPITSVVLQQVWPSEREMSLTVVSVRAQDGTSIGKLNVLRDVSAEREADRLKSDFVSLVSHELRTPLTSIRGYVDLLLERAAGPLTAEQEEFLNIVAGGAARLVEMTSDLLDVSRIEAGQIEAKLAPLDVRGPVRSIVASFIPQLASRQQLLAVEMPDQLPLVMADQNLFVQVLTNFVSNAHKYGPAASTVTLRLEQVADRIRISVTDRGDGLSTHEQQRLFTRFYRARNRATQQASGTGLGLAISKSLVEVQGGMIGVESTPGHGATFWFTLPIASEQRGPVSHDERDDSLSLSNGPTPLAGRVLIVEDEIDIAGLLQRYLERAGYHTSVALNGEDAMVMAITEQPDLITLDIVMPDIDGFALLDQLRANPETNAIPVLMISMMLEATAGARLDAVDHLSKPVDEHALLARVHAILEDEQDHTILIADDDDDARGYVKARLERAGYRVLEARGGWEAVALAARRNLSLALIDVRMPDLDGIETLRRLRAEEKTANLPVLMMTASPGVADADAAAIEMLGARLLLGKQFSVEDLATALSSRIMPEILPNRSDS